MVAWLSDKLKYTMCIDTEIADKLEAHKDINKNSPVLAYEGQQVQETTCLEVIENNFLTKYPLTSRRHEFLQLRQPRGELTSTHNAKLKSLALEADIATMTPEELISTMMSTSCSNEEPKDELLKLNNPSVEELDNATENFERKKNDMKRTSEINKAYVAKQSNNSKRQQDNSSGNNKNKPTCWACGYEGHRAPDCRKKKEQLYCKKCKKNGHVIKVCGQLKNLQKARQEHNGESSDSEEEQQEQTLQHHLCSYD